MKASRSRRGAGWTLIELIMALALMGGLAAVLARVVEITGRMVDDTVAQSDGAARLAWVMDRVVQEARQALPGSTRISIQGTAQFLEWVPQQAVGRYRRELATTLPPSGDILDFANPLDDRFDVLGPLTLSGGLSQLFLRPAGAGGAAVYNDANRRVIVGFSDGVLQFIPQGFWPGPASDGQFSVITGPVSWVCMPQSDGHGQLVRIHGYPLAATQPVSLDGSALAGGQRVVLVHGVAACRFTRGWGPGGTELWSIALTLLDQGVATDAVRSWAMEVRP